MAKFKNIFIIILGSLEYLSPLCFGEVQTILDPGFYTSARAGALAGATSCTANGLDASFYNPALIGGLKSSAQGVGNLHFPYLGTSYNSNAQSLKKSFQQNGGSEDPIIGEAIVNSNSGQRQFARFSMGTDIEWKRFLLNYFFDIQAAALSPQDRSPDPATGYTIISTKYAQTSGFGVGYSWMSASENFSIGIYSAKVALSYLDGELPYEVLIDANARADYLSQNLGQYQGTYNHFGFHYKLPFSLDTRVSLVARNPGSSVFHNRDPALPSLKIREDWVSGIFFRPKLKVGYLNVGVDFSRISERHEALRSKAAGSLEYSFDGLGNDSVFALRLGVSRAGVSSGIGLNLGLINLDLTSQATDIGDENDRLIEKRRSAVFSINLREI